MKQLPLLLLLPALICGAAFSLEASPEKVDGGPVIAAAKAPTSFFRVRIMTFQESEPIFVAIQSRNQEDLVLMENVRPSSPTATSYEEIPSKNTTIQLEVGGVSKKYNEDFLPDQFYTLLLYPKGSGLEDILLQDTFIGNPGQFPNLRILNFGSNRNATVVIEGQPTIPVPPNTFIQKVLLGEGTKKMTVTVPDPEGGYPALSMGEIQLSSNRATTIMIAPDYRGKFRPRIWQDGLLE